MEDNAEITAQQDGPQVMSEEVQGGRLMMEEVTSR